MRTCYPRPDFERKNWMGLNGSWRFAFDDADIGLAEGWAQNAQPLRRTIEVPFSYQSERSGVHILEHHEILWYTKDFSLPQDMSGQGRVMLCFGAVDWYCDVWVNGRHVCTHEGGYTPFSVDITDSLNTQPHLQAVTLRVVDSMRCDQPRGKQAWQEEPDRCWYTPCSGIWQSVWLECMPKQHMETFTVMPDLAESAVHCTLTLSQQPKQAGRLAVEVLFQGKRMALLELEIYQACTVFSIPIQEADYVDEIHYWTPENPNLYDIVLNYRADGACDTVYTYFGLRSIRVENGKILLNNRPFYQRLLLHQGYYNGGLLTAAHDDDFRLDLRLIKDMGFNGIRMHQKIEDPLLYYWADKLGLVVWGELPSCYAFNTIAMERSIQMMQAFIARDFNHPSIICWVPFNESWGLRNIFDNPVQQQFALSIYYLIKALDVSRIISTNDGWEQVTSDLCAIHDYAPNVSALAKKWDHMDDLVNTYAGERMIYADRCRYQGQPVFLSEYGGIAFKESAGDRDWGYCSIETTEEAFLARLSSLTKYIRANTSIQGFCYTQFSDVAQEINGLTDCKRTIKVPIEKLRQIFG